jgi:ketosteroid isomerase-like protein
MRVLARIACACALSLAIGAGQPAGIDAPANRGESVAESMRQLAKDMIAAYERRDTAALKGFYAKQPGALFFWERKMTYSWEQISSTMDGLVSAVEKLKLATTEFRAGGSGDTGWFAATFHIERVTPEGKQSSADGRWTVVAERIGGRWLIVHEHTSFPLPKS